MGTERISMVADAGGVRALRKIGRPSDRRQILRGGPLSHRTLVAFWNSLFVITGAFYCSARRSRENATHYNFPRRLAYGNLDLAARRYSASSSTGRQGRILRLDTKDRIDDICLSVVARSASSGRLLQW